MQKATTTNPKSIEHYHISLKHVQIHKSAAEREKSNPSLSTKSASFRPLCSSCSLWLSKSVQVSIPERTLPSVQSEVAHSKLSTAGRVPDQPTCSGVVGRHLSVLFLCSCTTANIMHSLCHSRAHTKKPCSRLPQAQQLTVSATDEIQ